MEWHTRVSNGFDCMEAAIGHQVYVSLGYTTETLGTWVSLSELSQCMVLYLKCGEWRGCARPSGPSLIGL